MRKISVAFLTLVLVSLIIFLVPPRTASADMPAPEYWQKKCIPGQLQIECRYQSDVPFGPKKGDCQRYENDPNYKLLVSTGSSFGGLAKYCLQSPSASSRLEHYLTHYPRKILPLLLVTLLLEIPTFALFGLRSKEALVNIFVANLVTVSVFYHFLAITTLTGWWPVTLAEIFIALFEIVFLKLRLKKFSWGKVAAAAVLANFVSAYLGNMLTSILISLRPVI